MVNGIMDVVKGTGSTKASQAQKSKKSSADDKSVFSQALTDAAGAANAQAERQTYDQKDAQGTEKGTESVQATAENPVQQTVLTLEGVEGQEALSGLMQAGVEGVQTADVAEEVSWNNSLAEAAQAADIAGQQKGTGAIKDLPQDIAADEEINLNAEDLLAKATVMKEQTEAKGQQSDLNMGEKAAASETTEEEHSIVDVNSQAAADKANLSFVQRQGTGDSGVVEAQVEVTATGEIKPEYENMLKDMIARQISNGRQEFEISLTPEHLGSLLIKVAHEAGETTVSIICSNAKAMQAMSSKAGELGKMLEATLGDKMDVVVEEKNGQESHFYDEGRNDSGAQAQKEEQERRYEEDRRKRSQEADSADFLQQLRLGLA